MTAAATWQWSILFKNKPVIEEIVIRPARPEDAKPIATVQIKTWQIAYAGIFPTDRLAALNEELESRAERWESLLGDAERVSVTFVAESGGRVIGFANGGKQVKANFPQDAELFAIYLLPEYHGKGIGRRMFTAAADDLRNLGFSSLLLWVLADNLSSRGFYERLGGEFCGEDDYLRWGRNYRLAAYSWPSLDALTGK